MRGLGEGWANGRPWESGRGASWSVDRGCLTWAVGVTERCRAELWGTVCGGI